MYIEKLYFIVVLVAVLNGYHAPSKSNVETVFEKTDSLGRVVERWGNEKTWDNDVNFREFNEYDAEGRVIRNLYYSFHRNNIDCIITDFDKDRYTETLFEYNNDTLVLEKKYNPVFNDQNEVIGHELYYSYNYLTRKESTY